MSSVDHIVIEAIGAQHEVMRRAFEIGDAKPIFDEYYTSDAWVFGDDEATWQGAAQIEELYAGIVGKNLWETKTERLLPFGDGVLEFLIGTLHPTNGDAPIPYRILFAWEKVNGNWKCATQMYAHGERF